MAINVNNPEADALTRKFAEMAGVGITDAIVIAMKEAIERRRNAETPLQMSRPLSWSFWTSAASRYATFHTGRATALAPSAADRYRSGERKLSLGDCLHYACAKHYRASILATGDEFRSTDTGTVA